MATKNTSSRIAPPSSNSAKRALPPNQTLYVTNLFDRLRKDDLRLSLYALFSTYGPVLDVVALKTSKMRGQAFVVYRDIQASTQAMRALQGFTFFGKEMRIEYAKTKSDTIAKLDGTYRPPGTQVEVTELQQTIFNAPPSSTTAAATGTTSTSTSLKPPDGGAAGGSSDDRGRSPQGVKRRRDEKGDESDDEDAPMDEDDDGDASMEDSSEEE